MILYCNLDKYTTIMSIAIFRRQSYLFAEYLLSEMEHFNIVRKHLENLNSLEADFGCQVILWERHFAPEGD